MFNPWNGENKTCDSYKNNKQKQETSAIGAFAFISHQVDSSQPPQANVELVSHLSSQNTPLCVSQALLPSTHTMIACLLHVYKIL